MQKNDSRMLARRSWNQKRPCKSYPTMMEYNLPDRVGKDLRQRGLKMEVARSVRSAKVTVDMVRSQGPVKHNRSAKNKMGLSHSWR